MKAILLLLCGALGQAVPDSKEPSGKAPPGKEPSGGAPGAKAPSKATKGGKAGKGGKGAARRPPPARVKLPEEGERSSEEVLDLAALLHGCRVVTEGQKVREVKIKIIPSMGGQQVDREELSLLLGAHGVYLFPHEGPQGAVLIATCDPDWSPERPPPFFRRSFQVRSREFDQIAREVERYVKEVNRIAPPGQEPAGAALDPRTRRIIVRAPTEKTIAHVAEIVARLDRPDPDVPHLYTYSPRHRRAEDLRGEVLDSLGEAEAERVSLVVSRRGNLLLIRSSEERYRKIEKLLQSLDQPGG